MSVRILHAADLHLDSPFEALTLAQAAQRRREQRSLLRALPELAQAHGAQIILLAGDLLDSASPYPETAKALAETFAGCASEVFLAPGNHDYYSAGAPYARLTFPENVHIFRSPRIEAVALPELGVRVWGAAFTDSRCPGLLRGFSVPKQAGLLDVLCLHGEVGNPASAYDPVSAAELAASGLRAIFTASCSRARPTARRTPPRCARRSRGGCSRCSCAMRRARAGISGRGRERARCAGSFWPN